MADLISVYLEEMAALEAAVDNLLVELDLVMKEDILHLKEIQEVHQELVEETLAEAAEELHKVEVLETELKVVQEEMELNG